MVNDEFEAIRRLGARVSSFVTQSREHSSCFWGLDYRSVIVLVNLSCYLEEIHEEVLE